METRGLLFIPDISGFSRFVHDADIEHSRLIIQELLELLINANQLGLEISEIEGDAILFYRFGEVPELQALYGQVKKMFQDFHYHLKAYERRRYCQCDACASAVHLTLKVITHYGEFANYNVRNFRKLIGRDVIVAHQLLKNDIEQHDYWLLTKTISGELPPNLADNMNWSRGIKQTETAEVPFFYTHLTALKDDLPAVPTASSELAGKLKVLSITKLFTTDITTLLYKIGDISNRNQWQHGVKATEEIEHVLPRAGMRFRLVGECWTKSIRSINCIYQTDKISFSEMDETNSSVVHFTLEKNGEKQTALTLDYYIVENEQVPHTLFDSFSQSLENLEAFLHR